jgi:EpsI family protein
VSQATRVAISATLLIGALLVLQLRSSGEAVPIRKPLDSFPTTVDGWHGAEGMVFDVDTLNVLKPKDYIMRRYRDVQGRNLWLLIAYWDSQRKGAQPHSPKNCLPGSGWEPLESSQLTVSLPQPFAPITVNRYLIQKDQDRLLVFYWYQSQGQAIASEVAAKVATVKSSVLRHRTDGSLVRISSPIYGNVQATSDLLVGYIQKMYPVLGEYLPD